MALSTGALVGIVIGSVVGFILLVIIICFVLRIWLRGPTKGSDNKKRLDGKLVVITGANNGIGKETAKDLARRGARVVMLVRSPVRGQAAIKDIKEKLGDVDVTMRLLDLSSLSSVRQCAAELVANEDKIDLLINNAGIMMFPQDKTEDGFDVQFGTNHLGHFLLTELLLPLLRKSASSGFRPRIVIVSSVAHKGAPINWKDINWEEEKSFDSWKAYCQSKLANIMHCKELARRLEEEQAGISVYCLHPGVVATDLLNNLQEKSCCLRCIAPCGRLMVKTPFHGAQTTLYCALDDSIELHSGRYYSDCKEARPHRNALIQEHWKRLWEVSEELVGLKEVP